MALLRHGEVVDKLNGNGCPALHLAAKGGSVAVVESLLAAGAQPDLRGGETECTAFDLAADGGCVDTVTALAHHGANVNATNKDGRTALHVATCNIVAVIDALIEAGADVDAGKRETSLHVATGLGLSEAAAALLRHGADTDKASYGDSALHIAASKNSSAAIVEALLAAGAKPNLRGRLQTTALGLAAEGGHVGVMEVVIQHGASLNAPGPRDRSPLHAAISENKFPVIEMLLAAGARVDVRNEDGQTPLHVASAGSRDEEYPEAIAALMRYGAGSIAFDSKGQAPLHLAIQEDSPEAANALLEAGADVNLRTKNGEPSLCKAAYWECKRVEGADSARCGCESHRQRGSYSSARGCTAGWR